MPCFGYDRHEINFCCWYFPLIILFSYLLCYSSLFQILLNWYFLCSVPLRYHLLISFLFIISISNQLLFLDIDVKIVGPDQKDIHRVWIYVTKKTCIAYILEHLYNRPDTSPTLLPRILTRSSKHFISIYINSRYFYVWP